MLVFKQLFTFLKALCSITQWAGVKEEVGFQVYSASVLLHKIEKHRNKFYYIETWGQCYKTFFVCNL